MERVIGWVVVGLMSWVVAVLGTASIYLAVDILGGHPLSWTLVLLTAFILNYVEFDKVKGWWDEA